MEVFTAETLGKGLWRASVTGIYERREHVYRGSHRSNDPFERVFQGARGILGLDYGVNAELRLSALFPFARNELRVRDPATGTTHQRAYGAGDLSVLASYRLLSIPWRKGTFQLALLGGLEMPTGDSSEREKGARLPRAVQVGGGSWNPFTALAAVLSHKRFRFDAHTRFKLNTKGRYHFDPGDEFRAELDAAYRFWHARYPGPSASARVGVRYEWVSRARENGSFLANTGRTLVWLRPSIGFHPIPRIDMSLLLSVPVYQHYQGSQLSRDWQLSSAFGVRF